MTSWLEWWYLENDSGALEAMVRVVLSGSDKEGLARREQLIKIIAHSRIKTDSKIPEYVFYNVVARADEEPDKLQIVVELIQKLLSRHAIQINAMFVKELKQLTVTLTEASLLSERTELVEAAKKVLPKADVESLLE